MLSRHSLRAATSQCDCLRSLSRNSLTWPRLSSRLAGTLKDTLGHTPLQVAVGAVVGVLTGYLTALLYL